MISLALTFLSKLPWRLAFYTALVVAVFFAGASWQKSRDVKAHAQQVEQQFEEYKAKVDKAIAESQALNARITGEIAQEEKAQAEIKTQVIEHLHSKLDKAQGTISELQALGISKPKIIEVCSAGDLYRVDGFTLGMLHSATDPFGPGADSPGRASEEGRAATEVAASDLIEYQLTVVGMYRELAKRHDALVDWIIEKQRELTK